MSNKLETLLRKAGRELPDYQVARFFKVPEEMQQTPCDFFGYTSTGRAILIEAKLVERPALPVGNSPGLLPHQWCELEFAGRAGALALLCWARGGICATLSFSEVELLSYERNRKSIPWADIPQAWKRSMIGPKAHLELLDRFLAVPVCR